MSLAEEDWYEEDGYDEEQDYSLTLEDLLGNLSEASLEVTVIEDNYDFTEDQEYSLITAINEIDKVAEEIRTLLTNA